MHKKRGPAPKPTALRMLDGGRSRAVGREPEPPRPVEIPVAPDYVTGKALEEWNRVIEDLYGTGVYANVDETMLAAYCMAYARWITAEADLEKMAKADPHTHGAMIRTANGNPIQNPLLGTASAARRDMARLASEFGLTPSSRTQIDAGRGRGGEDPVARKYGLS